MQAAADARGIRLRPHAKTHKSPVAGAAADRARRGRICCAKLGEAEVFADAGIEDIRLPYPLNPVQRRRVLALVDRVRLSFIVDDLEVARGVVRGRCTRRGARLDVLVKVDVGFHRCGIDPDSARRRGDRGARSRSCRDCDSAACSATPATPTGARRTTRPRRLRCGGAVVDDAGAMRVERTRIAGATRSASARRRRRASALHQERHHRAAARQLRLLRPHAGGARRRVVGRLRADRAGAGGQPAGARTASSSIAAARR